MATFFCPQGSHCREVQLYYRVATENCVMSITCSFEWSIIRIGYLRTNTLFAKYIVHISDKVFNKFIPSSI